METIRFDRVDLGYFGYAPRQGTAENAAPIHASHDLFQMVWDVAADAMALSSPDGTVLDVNPSYCALYGYSREALLGRSFAVIFPPEHRAAAEEAYRATFRAPQIAPSFESVVIGANGARRMVEARYTFLTKHGERKAMLSIIRDITDRKEAEQLNESRERRFRALIDNSTDAMLLVDRQWIVQFVSPSIERMLGYRPDEMVGHYAIEFVDPDTANLSPEQADQLLQNSGSVVQIECVARRRDGSPVWTENTLTNFLDDPDIAALVVNIRDVSERKQAQNELQAATMERAAREAAEQQVIERDTFLSAVAHELRTPVAGLRGYLDLHARALNKDPLDRSKLERYGRALDEGTGRLQRLLHDLLDLSRLTSGVVPMRCAEVDLGEVVHAVAVRFSDHIADTYVLKLSTPSVIVEADRDRLEQVVVNLINNAVKYSPNGGTVSIKVEQDSSSAVLVVADNGIGIANTDQAHLFSPFARATNAQQLGIKGTGLGLHICKQIIEAHNGSIDIQSEGEGQGTQVMVRLPSRRA